MYSFVLLLNNYLESVKEVSDLEIVGSFAEDAGEDDVDAIMHVVGRTKGSPHTYYYRRFYGIKGDKVRTISEKLTIVYS